MTETVKYLLKHNIKPSLQRIAIMNYLLVNKNHPTVDKIYVDLVKEIPTLSKTTIYNTLKLFEAKGALITLDIESKNIHYDADVTPHAHFRCNVCGSIYDMPMPIESINTVQAMRNFKVEAIKLYYKGVCDKCVF